MNGNFPETPAFKVMYRPARHSKSETMAELAFLAGFRKGRAAGSEAATKRIIPVAVFISISLFFFGLTIGVLAF